MKPREYPIAHVSQKAERSLRAGHPWVYGEEIKSMDGTPEDGSIVDVCSLSGAYLGSGFYNSVSKISVRIISRNANDRFDRAFWYRRVKYAIDYRRVVMPGDDFKCCRLIHGEADQFPGLTVDRYNGLLSVESLSLGTDTVKDIILDAITDTLADYGESINGIYLRNESKIRLLEGMETGKGWYRLAAQSPVTEIVENGIHYLVDVENGQKTGFFLDQKRNRSAAAAIAKGRRVLDLFTHTGSFGLNAAKAGAEHVTSVDISKDAIKMAEENARLNGLSDRVDFITADVFELLTDMVNRREAGYDYIILDPPAFTKSRSTVKNALRGYKEINMKAMRLLPRGGYLATCSCSHFMSDDLFRSMLLDAASDAQVSLRQIEARQQAPDHPILWNVPETDYLKFYIFQVV